MDRESENTAKVHRLRDAVRRLRSLQASTPDEDEKRSLIERLKSRLGLMRDRKDVE